MSRWCHSWCQRWLALAALLTLTLPGSAEAQDDIPLEIGLDRLRLPSIEFQPLPEDTVLGQAPPRRKKCDSIWDGAVFGVLPGVFFGFLYLAFTSDTGVQQNEAASIGLAAVAGAGVGTLTDDLHCDTESAK